MKWEELRGGGRHSEVGRVAWRRQTFRSGKSCVAAADIQKWEELRGGRHSDVGRVAWRQTFRCGKSCVAADIQKWEELRGGGRHSELLLKTFWESIGHKTTAKE